MNKETVITKVNYDKICEEQIRIDHKSGLTAFVIPKPGFSQMYAVFATNYGSIDREFSSDRTNGMITVPDGIAHFLEHKLFEGKDGNAFEKYALTGASANAYTSFDKTAYLFSCTDKFEENLRILLSFVQSPYFTDENVEKEQGIIGQEIRMYDDHPGFRVLFNMLNSLYVNHPVKVDIAGTVESISHITPEILNMCYDTFYNLSNMVLCIAGDVSVDEVIRAMDEEIRPSKQMRIERAKVSEPQTVANHYSEQKLEVANPKFYIGYKDICGIFQGREAQKIDYTTNILLEMIAGEDSELYAELFDSGLINKNFSAEHMKERDLAVSIIAGESSDPEKVAEAVYGAIEKLKTDFNEHQFETAKKKVYSKIIFEFNSTEDIANNMISCYFNDVNMFLAPEIIKSIDSDYAKSRLNNHFVKERSALSVIRPMGK